MRLKDGEYLFDLWDRLAIEKTLIDLVDLPHSVREEVPDLRDLPGWHPLCGQLRKDCRNASDMRFAASKMDLDVHWTGVSGSPNLVEQILDGFLQMLPLAPARHIMF